jgi:uncharacterized membrane-anchored protein YhcB (DUF1043 family)
MKKKAFGAIDLLIGLVLMAVVFLIGTNAFKSVSSININNVKDLKSVQEQVDEQVAEIERNRQKQIANNRML